MVCFRYIIVNTLHKGDNKDDDDDDNNNNNKGFSAYLTTLYQVCCE
jgi:hypothetical protein